MFGGDEILPELIGEDFTWLVGGERHPAEEIAHFVTKFKASCSLALSCAARRSAWRLHFMLKQSAGSAPFGIYLSHFIALFSIQACIPPPPLPNPRPYKPMGKTCRDNTAEIHSLSKAITSTMLVRLKCFGLASVLISKLAWGARRSAANEMEYDRHLNDILASFNFAFGCRAIIIDRLHLKLQDLFRMNDLCADNSSVLCTNDFRPDGIVVCGTFSPSKLCVAMSLSDGSVKLLHLQSDGLFASQQLIAGDSSKAIGPAAGAFHTTHHVGYLSFSPCGAFLACVTRHDPKVCIYDIATSCLLHTLHCSEHDRIYPCTQNIQAVSCILQMNCMLLAVGKSGSQAPVPATDCSSVQLWRMQEGFPATCIQVIRVKDTDVLDLSFSPASSSILALVSSGPTRVHMWVTKTSTAKSSSSVGPFDFTSTNFRCMDWDDDEGAIVTKLADGPKDCSSSGRRRSKGSQSFPHFPAVFGMHAGNLVVVRRSPNCNPEDKSQDNPRMSRECLRACATFQHSQQRKFDSVIHKIDVTSKVTSHEFRSVAISPSGLQLASCGEGGIGLWDLRTGQLFRQFGTGQEMRVSYLVCSGAVVLASFDKLGVLKLWV